LFPLHTTDAKITTTKTVETVAGNDVFLLSYHVFTHVYFVALVINIAKRDGFQVNNLRYRVCKCCTPSVFTTKVYMLTGCVCRVINYELVSSMVKN
jgi:hypothetical protein